MNDTAEGLISFLSAHETLGGCREIDGPRRADLAPLCLDGTACSWDRVHCESNTLRSPPLSPHWAQRPLHPPLGCFLKAPDLHFILEPSPLSISGPQNIPDTPLINILHFCICLQEMCIIGPEFAAAHAKTETNFDILICVLTDWRL